jgi:hypothetical protein
LPPLPTALSGVSQSTPEPPLFSSMNSALDVAVCKALKNETEIGFVLQLDIILPQRRFPNTRCCLILYESL